LKNKSSLTPTNKARAIAIYLPQFHPIPENDKWHGKGFTEWTNVTKAKPLFKTHYQPRLPSDLGFYDLRIPDVREAQAEMARIHGIEGFMYWHYWFGNGRRILEMPFNEVLNSGKPNFPFCLGWANDSWTGIWYGMEKLQLMKQEYPGIEDYKAHFYSLLPAFQDSRYMKVHGKPIFFIFQPTKLPNTEEFLNLWRELAAKEGLGDMFFISRYPKGIPLEVNKLFDANTFLDACHHIPKKFALSSRSIVGSMALALRSLKRKFFKLPNVFSYEEYVQFMCNRTLEENELPLVIPNFDTSARCGQAATVLHNSNPELFRVHVQDAIEKTNSISDHEHRIIFLQAWNEWAEGNHLEPDQKYGLAYLEAIYDNIVNQH
jgi:hypothetical protein